MPKKLFENFEQSLTQLKDFCSLPVTNDRDKAGIIQAFEFTFEQSWIAIKKLAENMGQQVPSPKQAFSFAMRQGWIKTEDEVHWLKMISDRNLTSHTYKKQIANEVLGRILGQYIKMLEELFSNLSRE